MFVLFVSATSISYKHHWRLHHFRSFWPVFSQPHPKKTKIKPKRLLSLPQPPSNCWNTKTAPEPGGFQEMFQINAAVMGFSRSSSTWMPVPWLAANRWQRMAAAQSGAASNWCGCVLKCVFLKEVMVAFAADGVAFFWCWLMVFVCVCLFWRK